MGAGVAGAQITVTGSAGPSVTTAAGTDGGFALNLAAGQYTLQARASGFLDAARHVSVGAGQNVSVDLTLQVPGLVDSVRVEAAAGRTVEVISSALRAETSLRDVPQAVSAVSRALMADQGTTSMAEAVQYMPGVGMAQGEGNRDTPVLRGNATTADFFVDGLRDDVQYFRDVYNLERVEALKGPNAMIFGRGGSGGVINRVTRQAGWQRSREAVLQVGSWGNRRVTADVGQGLGQRTALRATGLLETSESYRAGVQRERYGFNPTAAVRLSDRTLWRGAYEYFRDERTADRGVPSFDGRPVNTAPETFFGDPDRSRSDAVVHRASSELEHRTRAGLVLRNRLGYAEYDKFYQNVFPSGVDAAGANVSLMAYNNGTRRRNLFNQTDVLLSTGTGRIRHHLLAGVELGRQRNANVRTTGYFIGAGPDATSFTAPLFQPTVSVPLEFRPGASDADNDGVTTLAAVYLQDRLVLSDRVQAVAGVRVDRLRTEVTNWRTGQRLSADDGRVSPRLGLIYRPAPELSAYGSYSVSYLPRSGEQLSSLSLTNLALEPETFQNYEIGARWDVAPGLSFSGALYRLQRGNVAVPDPENAGATLLVDAQRTTGVELGLEGDLTSRWSVAGGYAWQRGVITHSISASAEAGARLPHMPSHWMSLWNRLALTSRFAAGLGVLYRSDIFASTDNRVRLPGWVRVDAAAYYDLDDRWRLQVNVENLADDRYFASAHNNANITPGSPRAVRTALTWRY